jgi:hypothetical protein
MRHLLLSARLALVAIHRSVPKLPQAVKRRARVEAEAEAEADSQRLVALAVLAQVRTLV